MTATNSRQEWQYYSNSDEPDDFVYDIFIAALKPFIRECETCGGRGEYETEYGPQGCQLCSSRLIPLRLSNGKAVDLDWGDIAIIEGGELIDVIRPRTEQ